MKTLAKWPVDDDHRIIAEGIWGDRTPSCPSQQGNKLRRIQTGHYQVRKQTLSPDSPPGRG